MPQPEQISMSHPIAAAKAADNSLVSQRDDVPNAAAARQGSRILRRAQQVCLKQMARVWKHLPAPVRRHQAGQFFGRQLNALVCSHAERKQYFGTFFLRNRAELELLRRIVDRRPLNSNIAITVLACSKGAEVYSMVWALRCARPDLEFRITAIDIAPEIVQFAAKGIYSRKGLDERQPPEEQRARISDVAWNTSRDQNAPIFERMTSQEFEEMFLVDGDEARVRPWLRNGVEWLCADAADPELIARLGPQDVVVANRFLCHMQPFGAERCLISIARLVKPGGYLFVSGVDLDVRTRVARRMGWKPLTELIREIHEGDTSLRQGWPLEYWGLEPMRENCPDWQMRYASAFQIGAAG